MGPHRCSRRQSCSSLALSQALLSLQPTVTNTTPHPWPRCGQDRCGTCPGKERLRPFPEQGNANTQPQPGTGESSKGSSRMLAKSSSFPALCDPWLLQPSPLVPWACSSRAQPGHPQPSRDLGRDELRPQSLLSCYTPGSHGSLRSDSRFCSPTGQQQGSSDGSQSRRCGWPHWHWKTLGTGCRGQLPPPSRAMQAVYKKQQVTAPRPLQAAQSL